MPRARAKRRSAHRGRQARSVRACYGYGAAPGGRGAPPPATAGGLPTTPTLKPGAEKYKVVRAADDTGPVLDRACRRAFPQSFFVPYYIQIVQAPKHIVVAHEYLNLLRIIPTDGRPHPPDPDPRWMGNAVGRWEGDTLVVDSIGLQRQDRDQRLHATPKSLHVVERFRRPDVEHAAATKRRSRIRTSSRGRG